MLRCAVVLIFLVTVLPRFSFAQGSDPAPVMPRSATYSATLGNLNATGSSHSAYARASADLVVRLKSVIARLKLSRNERLLARAQRLELWIPILSARTSQEYTEAVRRLPVKVIQSRADDGGVLKQFVAGGKVRLELRTAPAGPVVNTADEGIGDRSGPSLTKLLSSCYLEEEEPCQTPEEEDFWATEIAWAEAETDYAQADDNEAHEVWDEYCSNNSWDSTACDYASGPSSAPPCWQEALESGAGIFASAIAYLGAKGKLDDARLAGKALSVSSVAAARLTMVGAAITGGWSAGYFLGCTLAEYTAPMLTRAASDPRSNSSATFAVVGGVGRAEYIADMCRRTVVS